MSTLLDVWLAERGFADGRLSRNAEAADIRAMLDTLWLEYDNAGDMPTWQRFGLLDVDKLASVRASFDTACDAYVAMITPPLGARGVDEMTCREALNVAMHALAGIGASEPHRDSAMQMIGAMLDQRGCEHVENEAGLCETCDVIICG